MMNDYRVSNGLAYISLSRGQETVIDVEDLPVALKYQWHASPNIMGGFYACSGVKNTTLYLHRVLLDAPKGLTVDHEDHDTLNNRRYNLKLKTNQKNNENRVGPFINSKIGVRGVSTHLNNSGTPYYVFRCHCVNCKIAKYFPYNEEGLALARVFAAEHYAAMALRE